ncbi:MAG: ABC transporter permease [Planctomycetaceae bacterium]|nr:ABC transporter permease [Planctomycetaceae bacterium]
MFSFAFRNLFTRPVRSLLSLLGLTVAIAGMVGLFSVAEGLDAAVNDAFGEMDGLNVVQPGAPIPLFSTLPAAWGEEIANVPGVRVVSAEVWQRINVLNGKLIVSPPRFVCGADLTTRSQLEYDLYAATLKEGRFLNIEDIGTSNAVISKAIATEFEAQVGDSMTINGADATIVGIYETGSILLDVAVFMDSGFVRDVTRFDPETVSDFYVEADAGVEPDQLADRIEEHFQGREANPWRPPSMMGGGVDENPLKTLFDSIDRAIKSVDGELSAEVPEARDVASGGRKTASITDRPDPPADAGGSLADDIDLPSARPESAVEVRTAADWAQQVENLSADLDLILTILTSIGLLIALLSIINTMLMSVTERIIDFGILKANGWSKSDVLRLITFESGLLGFAGGALGAAIGWGATVALNASFPERLHLYASPKLLVFAVTFSTILGVAAGLYPALWAMRMMPMDAIRRG